MRADRKRPGDALFQCCPQHRFDQRIPGRPLSGLERCIGFQGDSEFERPVGIREYSRPGAGVALQIVDHGGDLACHGIGEPARNGAEMPFEEQIGGDDLDEQYRRHDNDERAPFQRARQQPL